MCSFCPKDPAAIPPQQQHRIAPCLRVVASPLASAPPRRRRARARARDDASVSYVRAARRARARAAPECDARLGGRPARRRRRPPAAARRRRRRRARRIGSDGSDDGAPRRAHLRARGGIPIAARTHAHTPAPDASPDVRRTGAAAIDDSGRKQRRGVDSPQKHRYQRPGIVRCILLLQHGSLHFIRMRWVLRQEPTLLHPVRKLL
jgi:hypothetical protein